jgi:Kef-type K+ transport system membrane component KefB/voltage-gated potassium channel Kch
MALAVGLILAMSSTAIGLQSLDEKGLAKTDAGQSAFSVLLFQDIAVIPILALLPLLAYGKADPVGHGPGPDPWLQALMVLGIVAGIIVGGRYLMRPVFRIVAATRLREVFTATALLLVIGIALAMQQVGLSPALGTFVAGVVLADNEYRHELEGDIAPFKGLLLGLFFLTVGASIDFRLLIERPWLILGLVLALVITKLGVLVVLGRSFRLAWSQTLLFGFALAQGGEFAFVLFSFATKAKVLPESLTAVLVAVVAFSMLLTPLLLIVNDRWLQPRFARPAEERQPDAIDASENPVIIAGCGRFGQVVARLLLANRCRITVLDHSPAQIDLLRRFGHKVFYGDAGRLDLLQAAGAAHARLLVVAIDDPEKTLEIAELARKHFPALAILARARDRRHASALIRQGVTVIRRETFGSALEMGVDALRLLGVGAHRAHRMAQTFRRHDEEALREMAALQDDESVVIARSRQLSQDLEQLLQSDSRDMAGDADRAWDVAARRGTPPA